MGRPPKEGPEEEKKLVNFNIPVKLRIEAQAVAKAEHRSLTTLVICLLEEHVKKAKKDNLIPNVL